MEFHAKRGGPFLRAAALLVLLMGSFLAAVGTAPTTVQADSSDTFESDAVGQVPAGYTSASSDANAKALVSDAQAYDGSHSLRIYDNSTAAFASIVKTFDPQSSLTAEFKLYPVAAAGAIQFSLGSGGSTAADTVFHLEVKSDGSLSYYVGGTWTPIGGAGSVAFDAWSTIRIVADDTAGADVYVNGVLLGSANPNHASPTIDRIRFATLGTPSTGDEFYVDAVNLTGLNVPGGSADSFESDTAGQMPAGYAIASSDANAKALVSDAQAYDGSHSLRIYDNSTAAFASIVKTFDPQSSLTAEFKLYPVAAAGAIQFSLGSGGSTAADTVFHLEVKSDGSLSYYVGGTWTPIGGAGSVAFDAWSTIRIVADDMAGADVYVNGVLLGSANPNHASSTIDRIRFATLGTPSTGDEFYVDFVQISGLTTFEPLNDNFDSDMIGQPPGDYATVDSDNDAKALVSDAQAVSGTQSLHIDDESSSVSAAIARTFPARSTARFAFNLYPVSADEANEFSLNSGGNDAAHSVFRIKLTADGSLYFQRSNTWYMIAGPGTVPFHTWSAITVNAADPAYADLYVNGAFVGTARQSMQSSTIDRLRFATGGAASTGDEFFVDDVTVDAADPAAATPVYSPVPVPTYADTPIAATMGYLDNDVDPTTGAIGNWGYTGALSLDGERRSIGIDLGSAAKVNVVRLQDSDASTRMVQEKYAVYASDDNATYTPVAGALVNSYTDGGRKIQVIEFSGVVARYLKITTTFSDTAYTFQLSDLQDDVQVFQRPDRSYRLPGISGFNNADPSPLSGALTNWNSHSSVYLDEQSRSVGVDLGIPVPLDALEVWDSDAATRIAQSDLSVYTSEDNASYTLLSGWTFGTISEGGRTGLRLDFPEITARYVKIRTDWSDTSGTFQLSDVQNDIRLFSSAEVPSSYQFFNDGRGAEGSFISLKDGSLLMGYNDFTGGSDTSASYLAGRKSTDGGYTWGAQFTILPNEGAVNTMKPSFIRMQNGDLGMAYQVQEASNDCQIYFRRSTDEGATWSNRILITAYPAGYNIVTSGNRILRLPSGRIIVPVAWSPNSTGAGNGSDNMSARVWYSDDDGATWTRSPGWVYLPHGALEPSVTRLTNGDLLMTLRTRVEGKIYKSISQDDGATWSQPVDTGLATPSSTNTVYTIPATGDVLLIWNNVHGTGNLPRNPLTVALSRDNGTTWHVIRNIMEGVSDSDNSTWPTVAFYGREVLFQFAHQSTNSTTVRILDIDTLYHSIHS